MRRRAGAEGVRDLQGRHRSASGGRRRGLSPAAPRGPVEDLIVIRESLAKPLRGSESLVASPQVPSGLAAVPQGPRGNALWCSARDMVSEQCGVKRSEMWGLGGCFCAKSDKTFLKLYISKRERVVGRKVQSVLPVGDVPFTEMRISEA